MAQLLDPTASEPLYRQIARSLADEVSGGVLAGGDRLPAERELCGRFGVSRVTLRRALAELVEQGVLESSHGRGWYVTTGVLAERPNALQSFHETARARGLEPGARVLAAHVAAATLEDSEQLAIAPGAQLFHLERLRLLSGVPIAFDHSRVPLALAPGLPVTDFATGSLYETLAGAGIVPTRADYTVAAMAADARAAQLLELAAGAPLLVTAQITFDQHDRPCELATMSYRGDRYRFRASLRRRHKERP